MEFIRQWSCVLTVLCLHKKGFPNGPDESWLVAACIEDSLPLRKRNWIKISARSYKMSPNLVFRVTWSCAYRRGSCSFHLITCLRQLNCWLQSYPGRAMLEGSPERPRSSIPTMQAHEHLRRA